MGIRVVGVDFDAKSARGNANSNAKRGSQQNNLETLSFFCPPI
jgi:hypothetical protein